LADSTSTAASSFKHLDKVNSIDLYDHKIAFKSQKTTDL
jgi:hypothetical protein